MPAHSARVGSRHARSGGADGCLATVRRGYAHPHYIPCDVDPLSSAMSYPPLYYASHHSQLVYHRVVQTTLDLGITEQSHCPVDQLRVYRDGRWQWRPEYSLMERMMAFASCNCPDCQDRSEGNSGIAYASFLAWQSAQSTIQAGES